MYVCGCVRMWGLAMKMEWSGWDYRMARHSKPSTRRLLATTAHHCVVDVEIGTKEWVLTCRHPGLEIRGEQSTR